MSQLYSELLRRSINPIAHNRLILVISTRTSEPASMGGSSGLCFISVSAFMPKTTYSQGLGTWVNFPSRFARLVFSRFLLALGPKVLEVCQGAHQSMHCTCFLSENVLQQATNGIFGELEVPAYLHFTTLTHAIA